MSEFTVCVIVTIAAIIILRYVVSLFSKKIKSRMMDMMYNTIQIDGCYTYRQSKGNTRPRYALVDDKKIEDGVKYVYYRAVSYNGYLSKYEIDDLIINDNIDEFVRKYEINDKPLKRTDIKISNSL